MNDEFSCLDQGAVNGTLHVVVDIDRYGSAASYLTAKLTHGGEELDVSDKVNFGITFLDPAKNRFLMAVTFQPAHLRAAS
jgi:hypothetical protein